MFVDINELCRVYDLHPASVRTLTLANAECSKTIKSGDKVLGYVGEHILYVIYLGGLQ